MEWEEEDEVEWFITLNLLEPWQGDVYDDELNK